MKIARMNTNDVRVATRLIAMPHAPHQVRRFPIGLILLGQVARVGLALFFTAGFAAGLSLIAGQSPLDPGPLLACTCSSPGPQFFWGPRVIHESSPCVNHFEMTQARVRL